MSACATRTRRRGICGAIAAQVLALVLTLAAPFDARAQSGADGASLYTTFGCFQCHGYAGQGGVAGPRIAPSAYPFAAFAALVRRPVNAMPAYAPSVLDDATLRTIYDFVRTAPAPPTVADIPELQ